MNNWIDKQLGQYQIVAEIGRGGMAVVYKAWQPTLGRYVAIKMLPPHFVADQSFLARFRREAMAAAQLNHSSIVTIHDVGQEGDTHFIVMEYLEGQSLYELLKTGGPMSLARVTHIVDQVASALDYAHRRGFVHRDIKPANIIVRDDDHATLTDFGIAKALSGTSLTQTGAMIGTPQYMAPEQVQGAAVDHRADIYALGIVCYEMLAGVPPFTGDTAAVLYAQAHKVHPPLRQRLPGLPAYVEGVLDQALAKDPAGRFASAGEMAAALEAQAITPSPLAPTMPQHQAVPAAPSPVAPTTPYPRARPSAQRRSRNSQLWLFLGGAAAIALICAAVLVIFVFGGGGSEPAAEPTRTRTATATTKRPTDTPRPVEPTPTLPGPTVTPSQTPSRPTVTPSSTTAAVTPPTPTSLPLRLAFVLGSPGDADVYLIDADGSNWNVLVVGRDDDAEPDWSPDEQRVAYQSDRAGNYDIWVIDADGQHKRQLTTSGTDERAPDWSPDGRQIVYRRGGEPNGDGELWVMDADGENQQRLGGQRVLGRAPVWSPDGGQVVFMSERGGSWDVYLFDLNSGSVRRVSNCSTHCRFPGWSPDGQYVVYHSTRSASSFTPVQIWRQRADGRGSATPLIEGNNPGRAAWSSAGLIAFNTDDGIEIVNADGSDRYALRNSDDGWAPDWSR